MSLLVLSLARLALWLLGVEALTTTDPMAHTPASASCLTFNAAAGFASNIFADAFDFVKRCLLLRLCVKVVLGWLLVNCEETIEDNTGVLRSYVEL